MSHKGQQPDEPQPEQGILHYLRRKHKQIRRRSVVYRILGGLIGAIAGMCMGFALVLIFKDNVILFVLLHAKLGFILGYLAYYYFHRWVMDTVTYQIREVLIEQNLFLAVLHSDPFDLIPSLRRNLRYLSNTQTAALELDSCRGRIDALARSYEQCCRDIGQQSFPPSISLRKRGSLIAACVLMALIVLCLPFGWWSGAVFLGGWLVLAAFNYIAIKVACQDCIWLVIIDVMYGHGNKWFVDFPLFEEDPIWIYWWV